LDLNAWMSQFQALHFIIKPVSCSRGTQLRRCATRMVLMLMSMLWRYVFCCTSWQGLLTRCIKFICWVCASPPYSCAFLRVSCLQMLADWSKQHVCGWCGGVLSQDVFQERQRHHLVSICFEGLICWDFRLRASSPSKFSDPAALFCLLGK